MILSLLGYSPPVRIAHADDLSDRLRMLFSTQFSFTREGLPLLSIGIMDRQDEIVVSGDGVRVLPTSDGGPEIRSSGDWHVTVEGGRPAKLRYHVIVARLRPTDNDQISALVSEWQKRGFSPRTFEIGAVFGISGEVLDRRALVLCVSPRGSRAEAEAVAQELRQRHHIDPGIHVELVDRPAGIIVARNSRGVEVRSEGALWFAPLSGAGKVLARNVQFGSTKPSREDRSYWGKLYVAVDRSGKLALVNAVPENKLLAGLVPAEIPPSAPEEALKAQAVAARAELLAKIGTRHFGDPYLICSSVHCQVYAGAGREHPRTTAAVDATRGQVLFRKGLGDLADTVYSSSCGGMTESNENSWEDTSPDPTLRGRPDAARDLLTSFAPFGSAVTDKTVREFVTHPPHAFCEGPASSRYRWTLTRDAQEVMRMTQALGVGPVTNLVVKERGVSGRAKALEVVGKMRTVQVRGELKIRQLLGNLYSAMFVVDVERDSSGTPARFVFSGGGFGHGVGLCQTGAMGMAQRGYNYADILKHYYRGVELKTLY